MARQFGENLDDWVIKTEKKSETDKSDVAHIMFAQSSRLLGESRANEALTLINVAIENDEGDWRFYAKKASILEALNRYSEADSAHIKAIDLNPSDENKKIRAEMLYRWANSLNDKNRALEIITQAIEILPAQYLKHYREKFWYLKGSILDCLGQSIESRICYMKAEGFTDQIKELEEQIEFLKSTKDTLISITGTRFYFGIEIFTEGLVVDLIKEPENEHDSDAIRVEIEGEKVGYVANSEYTMVENIKSATDINKMNPKKAEVIFIYMDEYVIAKLVS